MAYRKVRQLKVADAAYIAGLVDGEGTITLSRKHRNENRQLSLTVSSTERPLLTYLRRVIGAGRITNKRPAKSHHSPSGAYAINNRQAYALIEQISPYLRSYKAKRARLVLRDYLRLTPRNGKYTVAQTRARHTFVRNFLAMRSNPSLRPRR